MNGSYTLIFVVEGDRLEHRVDRTLGHSSQFRVFATTAAHRFDDAIFIAIDPAVGCDFLHTSFPLPDVRDRTKASETLFGGS